MLAKKIKIPLLSMCICISCSRMMMPYEIEKYIDMQIRLQFLDFEIEPICISCMTTTLNLI